VVATAAIMAESTTAAFSGKMNMMIRIRKAKRARMINTTRNAIPQIMYNSVVSMDELLCE
jgi:hypothetical protein